MHSYWNMFTTVVNLIIMALSIFYCWNATKKPEEYLNSPTRFDVYEIEPFKNWTHIQDFVDTNITGKFMCVSAGDPATCEDNTQDMIVASARKFFECDTADLNNRPAFCSYCIDLYASRMHNYGVADGHNGTAIDTKKKEFVTLRRQLEGCISRTAQWSTVKFMQQTNVWVQFLIWSTIMAAFSVAITIENLADGCSRIGMLAGFTVLALGYGFAIGLSGHHTDTIYGNGQGDRTIVFDIGHVFSYQVLLLFLAVGMGLRKFYKATSTELAGTNSYAVAFTQRLLLFDILVTLSVPCFIIIVCCYSAMLDYDMIVALVTSIVVIMSLMICDDLLNIFWSKQEGKEEKEMHAQLHTSTILLILFSIIFLVQTNFPTPPSGDNFHGQLMRVLLYGFVVVMTLFPSVFHQFSGRDSREIIYYKEGVDLLYRLLVLSVMAQFLYKDDAIKT